MGMQLQVGSRLRSTVCTAEVVVVKAAGDEVDLRCGGAPMVPAGEGGPEDGAPAPGLDSGALLGKRYTDGGDLELLCSKAGDGTLSLGSDPLEVKGAKPLPSSD